MPFTSAPSRVHRDDPRAAAIERAASDDSHDARAHTDPAIKRPCSRCDAQINERCVSERYPSGRPRHYAPQFHAERAALVTRTDPPAESELTMTTTTEKPAARTRAKSRTDRAAELAARDSKPASQPKPAARQHKSGDPRADRAASAAKSQPKPAPEPKPEPAAKPKPPKPAELTARDRKRIIASAAIRALADLAEHWADDHVSADEARALLSSWAAYLPGNGDTWDARLGERSDAGRRSRK